jgi:hypothetical protein
MLTVGLGRPLQRPSLLLSIHHGTLLERRLVWRRSGRGRSPCGAQVGTASLRAQLRLDVNAWSIRQRMRACMVVWLGLPFSSKILSSREFLYRSIRHSSAAVRCVICRFCKVSSWCFMVLSSCLMYSVRRSRKAAWAWRLRCLRSSEVAYILRRLVSAILDMATDGATTGAMRAWGNWEGAHWLAAALALLLLLRVVLGISRGLEFGLGRRGNGRGRSVASVFGLAHAGSSHIYDTTAVPHLQQVPRSGRYGRGALSAKLCERRDSAVSDTRGSAAVSARWGRSVGTVRGGRVGLLDNV